jgi:glycosyltransferase involved in cell wall biosynthesis
MEKISVFHLENSLQDSSIIRIIHNIVTFPGNEKFNWVIGSMNGLDDEIGLFHNTDVKLMDYSGKSPWVKLRSDLQTSQIQVLHTHTPRTIIHGWRAVNGLPAPNRPIHIATKHLLNRFRDRQWGIVYTLLDYLSLYLPDMLVPVSRTMGKQILMMPGISDRKVMPILNGVSIYSFSNNHDRNSVCKELGIPEDAFIFGYAGRLDRVKRIDSLLSALKVVLQLHPAAHLLILGEGQLKLQLQDQAQNMGIAQAVTWAGFRNDMPRMMAAMNIYVQPSDNEGLSLSILEAMAAHRPVIATTVGAASEVLVHGQTGWLIPPGSIKELAAAMLYLSGNTEITKPMSEAAFKLAGDHYSTQNMVSAYRNLYSKLVSEKA